MPAAPAARFTVPSTARSAGEYPIVGAGDRRAATAASGSRTAALELGTRPRPCRPQTAASGPFPVGARPTRSERRARRHASRRHRFLTGIKAHAPPLNLPSYPLKHAKSGHWSLDFLSNCLGFFHPICPLQIIGLFPAAPKASL